MDKIEKLLSFFDCAEKLKKTIRYKASDKSLRESSAAHSWKLALMALTTIRELKLVLNLEKSMKLAIVHDLAEAITDDIDYFLIADGKFTKTEKRNLEVEAMSEIKKLLSDDVGEEIYNLWSEFDNGLSEEAKFIKALDRIEALTHLLFMGHKFFDRPELIANYADSAVLDFPELTEMLKKIKEKFKLEFEKGGIPWIREYDII